ncbi:MAG: FIST N-terminal domain-containing protein [Methylococcales bacterium]
MRWTAEAGWSGDARGMADADLVLVFADAAHFREAACYDELRARFHRAHIVGCSSSGSVMGTTISDDDIVATAIRLERGSVAVATVDVAGQDISALGRYRMDFLRADDLRHVLVLSEGLMVNGSELAGGLNVAGVPVTGGMAGDGTRFGQCRSLYAA